MEKDNWSTKRLSVANLHLDDRNPRLDRETTARSPREIIQYLFQHDKAVESAQSIASCGYFPNEPLLAVKENGRYVVVEGNRRLAALKALREPGLLEGKFGRQLERLSRQVIAPESVPVTIAPNRRATDRQIARRHRGTPVLAWRPENRASFILEKIEEGYDNDDLRDILGFNLADIQKARQTKAIAEMARSLGLPEEVQAKIDNARSKVFSTLERVFDSTIGRSFLKVKTDTEHGLRGTTTKKQFIRGFTRLVTDVAMGHQSSRTLNKNKDIKEYFESLPEEGRVDDKQGSFVPADIIKDRSSPTEATITTKAKKKQSKRLSSWVLPKDFKVRHGSDRIIEIHRELTRLKREDFPNAGAVLLRVFFELTVLDYLKRTGKLQELVKNLKERNERLSFGTPAMKQLVPEIEKIAEEKLSRSDANNVMKAIQYNAKTPFNISSMHSFVHNVSDLPTASDIQQFWLRTEPLFRLMLENDAEDAQK